MESTSKMIFQGVKFYWRTRNTIDIMLVKHPTFNVMEIVTYDPIIDREAARLYLDSKAVIGKLDSKEIEKQLHAAQLNSINLDEEHFTHKAAFEFLTNHLVITEYSVAEKRMVVAMNGMEEFAVEKPAALVVFQSPHYHTLLEGVVDQAMRAMEGDKAELRTESESARKFEAIVQASFTKDERWRIPAVFVKICRSEALEGEDAQIWQKVTATIQSEADADRLATVLAPFGLTVPQNIKKELVDAVASNASAVQNSEKEAAILAQSLSLKATAEAAEAAVAPAPLVSEPVPTQRAAKPSHSSLAVPKPHVEPAAKPAKKAPAPVKAPIKKSTNGPAPPARRSGSKAAKLQPTGKGVGSAPHSGIGEDSALHPAIKRLVDTMGSAASALRSNFRREPAARTRNHTSQSSAASSGKSTATSCSSLNTSAAPSFSAASASSFNSGQSGAIDDDDDDASVNTDYQQIGAAFSDVLKSQHGLYGDPVKPHGTAAYGNSGASVNSADTRYLSVNEDEDEDEQPPGEGRDTVGFEDEGLDEDVEACAAAAPGNFSGWSTKEPSTKGTPAVSLSSKLTKMLFRSFTAAPVAPFEDPLPYQPYQSYGSGDGREGGAGGFSLVRLLVASVNGLSGKRQVFPSAD